METCVPESGGTFFIKGKRAEDCWHAEVLERLSRQIEDLRGAPPAA